MSQPKKTKTIAIPAATPHRGTLVATSTGYVEISIFETGVPPHFRLYFFDAQKIPSPPVDPKIVSLETARPDGKRQEFSFIYEPGYLRSTSDIPEPHEFTVFLKCTDTAQPVQHMIEFTEEYHLLTHGHGGGHSHSHGGGFWGWLRGLMGHSHRVEDKIDATVESNARGIWAIKISLIGLLVTSLAQLAVVFFTGSVALLADTIHNFGDAATNIPLWIAFTLSRRGVSRKFTYGYGKTEDLAGVIVVFIIFFSACVAGYESVMRIIHPQPMANLWAVAIAAVVGFLGNEAVAVFRLKVGHEIESTALIADGQHARVDGFTSLAVLFGVIGTGLGFPIFDPIIGMIITVAILFIVKDTIQAVFFRMLDGIEPPIIDLIERTPLHIAGVLGVSHARARWVGHKVLADLQIAVNANLPVREADRISAEVETVLRNHLKSFGGAVIQVRSVEAQKS